MFRRILTAAAATLAIVAVGLAVMALAGQQANPYGAQEWRQQHAAEVAQVEHACSFGRATAEASGRAGLDFYERECE